MIENSTLWHIPGKGAYKRRTSGVKKRMKCMPKIVHFERSFGLGNFRRWNVKFGILRRGNPHGCIQALSQKRPWTLHPIDSISRDRTVLRQDSRV